MNDDRYPLKGATGALPETVVTALISASDEVSERETWTAPRRGGASGVVPRIISVIMASQAGLQGQGRLRKYVRENALRILAYLPADLRLGALIDLSSRNPEALDDIFTGSIGPQFESYRFNIISSLAVFARHGLVEEVFTHDRIAEVGAVVRDVKKTRASRREGR